MTRERSDSDPRYRIQSDENCLRRRALLAAGGTAGAALIAGCTSGDSSGAPDGEDADDTNTDDDAESSGGDTGAFRLLVTDLPADIGDFDSLEVTLDRARVFRGESGGSDEEGTDGAEETLKPREDDGGNESEGGNESGAGNETRSDEEESGETEKKGGKDEKGSDETDGEKKDGESQREFFWLDLKGATVDLTDVIGDRAVSVFEGELEAGTYSKVELHAAGIEGIVGGEPVDVKIPSGKLQIVHSFEVRPDESVEFVFDIHVVKKGNGGYNLRPVISGSGVNGKDVEVEEVDPDEEGGDDSAGDGGEGDGDAAEASDEEDGAGNRTAADGGE